MQNPLEKLAEIQLRHTDKVILLCLLLTVFLGLGIPKIQIQTDFQEGLPNDLPPIVAEEKIQAEFGNTESLIILFKTNEKTLEKSYVTDIRDPRMVRTLNFLERELEREPIVASTSSMASIFSENPETKDEVKRKLRKTPVSYVNRDFTATTMFVRLTGQMSEKRVRKATETIETNLDEAPSYPGIEASITGLPAIRTTLATIVVNDTTRIIAAASALILVLLTGVRGLFYGPATFAPLFMGLLWTLGAMGWIGLPLTIVTISLASMLLGLGVEYGSFIAERIVEEAEESDIEKAVKKTMPSTGKAVLGSSTTDLVGFLALLTASISFLRDLGLTLALGEALTLTGAIVLTPSIIIKYERWKK
ncbi:MAG: MMPL family transporter [Candidatus Nanosalina sp.]